MTRAMKRSPFQYRPVPLACEMVRVLGLARTPERVKAAYRVILKARRGRGHGTTKSARAR